MWHVDKPTYTYRNEEVITTIRWQHRQFSKKMYYELETKQPTGLPGCGNGVKN